MKYLVTGNAGFIGFHTAKTLLERGHSVVGFDSVNDYYDPQLKEDRLKILDAMEGDYHFYRANLADKPAVDECFKEHQFDRVIHLAAQAGVRHSMEHPEAYVESNLIAFTNMLEACRYQKVPHLTYASTSGVYGANTDIPFSEHQTAAHPLQFYAATKRANELMAHAYSNLFNLPTTALRFFTAYGTWGRPDMALFIFTKNILEGKPIQLFNHGNHTRDFTYITDIVEGILRSSDNIAQPNPDWDSNNPDVATSFAPFRILNIGNNHSVKLVEYIETIEEVLGMKAERELLPLQAGDIADNLSDVSELVNATGYKPSITVQQGVREFVDWYRDYYKI
ncbi:MAG: NAD-dependent epimerase [Rickettsiales bacterium]|nr:NAD-dependent epimerase [Rickettsiales bacterium]